MKRLALFLFCLALLPVRSGHCAPVSKPVASALVHDLDVRIDPAARTLAVADSLTLPEGFAGPLRLELSPKVRDLRVACAGRELPARFGKGLLVVDLPAALPGPVSLAYALSLDAPPERIPAGNDNPGALAGEATAGPDWAMLLPGAAWHPQGVDTANAFRLAVTAPPGEKAVTQGALLGFTDTEGQTVSRWDVPRPEGRLGLCLAPYVVERADDGPVPVLTFLLPGSAGLAPVYLAASVRHLAFSQDLHGPYPFEKFAVVENPLPTGYGFPSYTLLGSQVIALPFIPAVSLRHEIAHNWWGCGVLVDYARGNWCEGLTTYVADFLAQELASPEAGRAYRLKALRGFAELTAGGRDFPLDRFGSRTSPAGQAVGYTKALFVFHMLRRQVGDEAFFAGLRRLYSERLFRVTSWEDIRTVFAGLPGFSEARSRVFLRQWLTRTGGPRLALGPVRLARTEDGYRVTGSLRQTGEPYTLRLTLRVDTVQGPVSATLSATGASTPFALDCPQRPTRLTLDPEADVFRLLDAAEIPPSVNAVKGSRSLTVVLAESASPALVQALPALLAGLNRPDAAVLGERSLTAGNLAALAKADLLVVGAPARPDLLTLIPTVATLQNADTAFAVLERPGRTRLLAAFVAAAPEADPADVATALAKITHYGAFGRLAFAKGVNVVKEVGEPASSPLVRDL